MFEKSAFQTLQSVKVFREAYISVTYTNSPLKLVTCVNHQKSTKPYKRSKGINDMQIS